MSTQIEFTVKNLLQKKLIKKSRLTGRETAQVWIDDNRSLRLFIVDDRYEITIADVKDAIKCNPKPDYFVHSTWQGMTLAAENEAKHAGLTVVSFGRLCHILEELAEIEQEEN